MSHHGSRFYRALLYLLPPSLRRRFGADMEQLLRDRLKEATTGIARVGIWISGIRDVGAEAGREWVRVVGDVAGTTMREGMGMDGWIQDVRFALRSLVKRPGFTIAAVGTLALGIGANVSIFSVVNGVLLTPLPFEDPDDLVVVWSASTVNGDRSRGVDHPDVRLIDSEIADFDIVGLSGSRPTLTGFGTPEVLAATRVTDGVIELMGFEPTLGRDLTAADDNPFEPRVAVVSHGFWTDRLARDPDALGRTITLSGNTWEIVGVGPEGFDYPNGVELWLPRRHESDGCGHGCRILNAIGRVAPSSTVEGVQAQLDAISTQLAEEHPDSHRDSRLELESMLEYEVADVKDALWVLLGAVGMVLLIACANVANLLLVRAGARTGEVALRATLGASRLRIVRQLLTESALIAVAGGALGLGFSYWTTAGLIALAPDTLPRIDGGGIEPTVVIFALALVVFATGLFGLLPALNLSRQPLNAALSGGKRTLGRRGGGRSRTFLLVGEVALSVTLLLGTGLLLRTLNEIRRVDLGFDVAGIERFRVSIPGTRYDSLQTASFFRQLESELGTIPGVESAGWGFGVPLASGNITTSISLLDRPELPPPDRPSAAIRPSTPGFLAATGHTLLRGRWFDEGDRYGATRVAVVNEAAVRAFYPDRDPIGLHLRADVSWSFADSPSMEIVGVVQDVIRRSLTEEPEPAIYVPNAQFGANTGYVSLRLRPGVESVIPEARAVVESIDSELAIWGVSTMDDAVVEARAASTFYATLLTVFSVVALLLAAVGLYGVVAYAVSQRTREIGIRIALGAEGGNVTSMVLRQGAMPALVGLVLGLVASWFGMRVLESLLFGVSPQDPVTILSVTLLLLVVAALATFVPARRASRIAPATALRME